MAQYDSLKEYLKFNCMDTISSGLSEHIRNSESGQELRFESVDIRTLAWKAFNYGVLTLTVGVSAELIDNDSSSILTYYNITIHGSVLTGLTDLSVDNIKAVDEDSLQEETILSLFGLENITADNLEERAAQLRNQLCSDISCDHKYRFPVIAIKNKFGLKIWPADLGDNCFGRLYLLPSHADIYDPADLSKQYPQEPIPRGSILLNKKYFLNRMEPDDIVTAAHELVHWSCHQLYFIFRMLLDKGFDSMNCTSESLILDEGMSLAEKAYFYAEWQANELAIRLAMPKEYVEKFLAEYAENHDNLSRDTYYYEQMVDQMRLAFNIPISVIKKRMRQLGYYFFDGISPEVDGVQYPSFTLNKTLRENESYIINRRTYERLLRENTGFAELINSGGYVYLGYVVCLHDVKYYEPEIVDGRLRFVLSDYAKEHIEECCLKIESYIHRAINKTCFYQDCDIFNRLKDDEYEIRIPAEKPLNAALMGDIHKQIIDSINEDKRKAEQQIAYMHEQGITSFADKMRYHKKQIKGLTYPAIERKYGISEDLLKAFVAPKDSRRHRKPSLENVMVLCHAFRLLHDTAIDFLATAGYALDSNDEKHKLFDYLLYSTNAPIEYWDRQLSKAGFSPLTVL